MRHRHRTSIPNRFKAESAHTLHVMLNNIIHMRCYRARFFAKFAKKKCGQQTFTVTGRLISSWLFSIANRIRKTVSLFSRSRRAVVSPIMKCDHDAELHSHNATPLKAAAVCNRYTVNEYNPNLSTIDLKTLNSTVT